MVTNLKDRRVIITAGPTWVKIDAVRVISNNATGSTGILLAEKLVRLGAKVTLLMGPVEVNGLNKKIRLLRFQYFDELESILKKELKTRKYDLAIHSAAVSDYKPRHIQRGKISSGLKQLEIIFIPTVKIIDVFKKLQPRITLAAFKFEPFISRLKLIKEARQLIYKNKANFVIANTQKDGHYLAYLVMLNKESAPIFTKNGMADNLIKAFEII